MARFAWCCNVSRYSWPRSSYTCQRFAPPRINSVCNSVVQLRRKVCGVTATGSAKRSPGRRTRFKSVC